MGVEELVVTVQDLAASVLADAALPATSDTRSVRRIRLRWLAGSQFCSLGPAILARLALLPGDSDPETVGVIVRARQELELRGIPAPPREDGVGERDLYRHPDGELLQVTQRRVLTPTREVLLRDVERFSLPSFRWPCWPGLIDWGLLLLVFPLAWPALLLLGLARWRGWGFSLSWGLLTWLAVVEAFGVAWLSDWRADVVIPCLVACSLLSGWGGLRAAMPGDRWRISRPIHRLTLFLRTGQRVTWTGPLPDPEALQAALERGITSGDSGPRSA